MIFGNKVVIVIGIYVTTVTKFFATCRESQEESEYRNKGYLSLTNS